MFEGHPSWRAVLSFYIGGVAGALVIAVVVGLVASTFVGVLTAIVLIALVVVAGLIKRTATDYMVTNQRLYIRRGILSKREQQTRIDRVQNVNTEQRFRDRLLRVGTVDFDTAGTDDAEFRFVGISDPAEVVRAVDRAQREALRMRPGERRGDGEPEHGRQPGGAARLRRGLRDHRVDQHHEQRPGGEAVDRGLEVAAGGVGQRVAADRRERADGGHGEPHPEDRRPAAAGGAQVGRGADRLRAGSRRRSRRAG